MTAIIRLPIKFLKLILEMFSSDLFELKTVILEKFSGENIKLTRSKAWKGVVDEVGGWLVTGNSI